MKALVTGGAGFIGSHLVDSLRKEGHQVVVLDDLSSGKRANLESHLGQAGFDFIEGSVRDEATVAQAMAGCQWVFHLAAVVGVERVVTDPLSCILTNVGGTEAVLAAAHKMRAKVVLASSSEVYGKSAQLPFVEGGDSLLGPPTVSRWAYALSKALDEQLALAYAAQGLPVVVLRYFNAYGPRLDPRGYGSVAVRFLEQARRGEPLTVYGDGRQSRAFSYVSDIVAGTLAAAQRPEAQGQVINLGSDREITIQELAETVLQLTGATSSIVHLPYEKVFSSPFEDPPRRVPALDKARQLLGFSPQVSLEEGLRRTAAWLKDSQE